MATGKAKAGRIELSLTKLEAEWLFCAAVKGREKYDSFTMTEQRGRACDRATYALLAALRELKS